MVHSENFAQTERFQFRSQCGGDGPVARDESSTHGTVVALVDRLLVALGVAKHAFGGIGQNIFNPALVGRVFLLISFPTLMTKWTAPVRGFTRMPWDAMTSATALGVLKGSGFSEAIQRFSYVDLFFGNVGGCIGETSAFVCCLASSICWSGSASIQSYLRRT